MWQLAPVFSLCVPIILMTIHIDQYSKSKWSPCLVGIENIELLAGYFFVMQVSTYRLDMVLCGLFVKLHTVRLKRHLLVVVEAWDICHRVSFVDRQQFTAVQNIAGCATLITGQWFHSGYESLWVDSDSSHVYMYTFLSFRLKSFRLRCLHGAFSFGLDF